MPILNDVHSKLNATEVARVERPATAAHVADGIARARAEGLPVIACGRRHAMGGQQFAPGGVVVDTAALVGIGPLDRDRGTVRVEAGATWPELLAWLEREQAGDVAPLVWRQKQTGADDLTIGGAVAANAHGRGLALAPFVADVESLLVVGADGAARRVSRDEHGELFSLVVGGYGLFGIVVEVELRLAPRTRLLREVEEVAVDRVIERLEARRDDGCTYGDWQFDIDAEGGTLLQRGIMSCYRPVADDEQIDAPSGQVALSREGWAELVRLTERGKALAYEAYRAHYAQTAGQAYHSDTHQLATYLHDYADLLREVRDLDHDITLMIGELYVPRTSFSAFAARAAEVLRETGAEVLYGTVRLIERDDETVLAWAREPWACTIFNVVVEDAPGGADRARAAFRGLIDAAIQLRGSFFLTYHLWADAKQVRAAHPRIHEFLDARRRHDVHGVFESAWSRRLEALLDRSGAPA